MVDPQFHAGEDFQRRAQSTRLLERRMGMRDPGWIFLKRPGWSCRERSIRVRPPVHHAIRGERAMAREFRPGCAERGTGESGRRKTGETLEARQRQQAGLAVPGQKAVAGDLETGLSSGWTSQDFER